MSAGGGRRPRVGILFGGESPEHEVSLESARNVVDAIDPDRWDVLLVGIDRSGRWHLADAARALDPGTGRLPAGADESGPPVTLVPGADADLVALDRSAAPPPVDVVFPVLHGPMGEDGTVQGLLRLAHVPFVGPGVLGSAIGMDKDVTKRLLRDAGIHVAPFITATRAGPPPDWDDVVGRLGTPLFVKPANMGSSVGVSRVSDAAELEAALEEAFAYDTKVLVEAYVAGREIECAVLGNEHPEASVPGEIVPRHGFYSYEAKYLDDAGADLEVPADLDEETTRRVRELAVRTFETLCCEGMARVDFFLTADGSILVNEINTIPGFTRISMYPKLWAASGVPYPDLIDRLLRLAIARSERERGLKSRFEPPATGSDPAAGGASPTAGGASPASAGGPEAPA